MTRARGALAGLAGLAAVACVVVVVSSRATPSGTASQEASAITAPVERGALSATVSLHGTLTHRARADGSPYTAMNQARGTYTALPAVGDAVGCGDELYRVDDRPVLLLCGTIPTYRDLRAGDQGNDVQQLNANLHALGFDAGAGVAIDPEDHAFSENTAKAVEQLQRARSAEATGELRIESAVFLPEPLRIAQVAGELGASAQPGAPVLHATADALEVRVALEGSDQRAVQRGDAAQIILPSNTSVAGTVERVGTVVQAPAGQNDPASPAAIAATIDLDDRSQVRGLDEAPVRVEITTHGVQDVLSVPVVAVVGRSGGGVALEVVRDGGGRELVSVKLGLFDTSASRVQVEGDVHEGDHVVVPAS